MTTKHYILSYFFALIFLITLLTITPVSATSGACSYHGGVNCSAGADYDGSVICYDGWTASSVLYSSEISCKNSTYIGSPCPQPSLSSECSDTVLTSLYQTSVRTGSLSNYQSQFKKCEVEKKAFQIKMDDYNDCSAYLNNGYYDQYLKKKYTAEKPTSCQNNSYMGADLQCHCNPGFQLSSSGYSCEVKPRDYENECLVQHGGKAQYINNKCYWCTEPTDTLSNGLCIPKPPVCDSQAGYVGKDNVCHCNKGYEFNLAMQTCLKAQPPEIQIFPVLQGIPTSQSTTTPVDIKTPKPDLIKARQTTNVRLLPKSNSKIIGTTSKNTTSTILETRNGWYKITMKNGKIGWVLGKNFNILNK
jgi:hypothetical protein